ncbi:MAG: hypothetical protein M0R06_00455 [Sphaerochaeta sp.]|jgi:hypothetical protein|nr:hypothetical protein [Sphaerochaeta sp.]
MQLQIKANIEEMKATVKTKKEGEDLPLRVIQEITVQIPASPENSAKLTALHQMLATSGQPVSITIACDQALFDLDVNRVNAEAKAKVTK